MLQTGGDKRQSPRNPDESKGQTLRKQTTPQKIIYTKKARQALKLRSPSPESDQQSRSRSVSPSDDDVSSNLSLESITETLAQLEHKKSRPSSKESSPERPLPKKSTHHWTLKEEQQLCTLWEDEPHLYKTTDQNYRNSHLRWTTYERMAAVLDLTAIDVDVHIKSLRTVFRKLLHLPSGSSRDRLTQQQKDILKLCGFLRAHCRSKEGISNLPKKPIKQKGIATTSKEKYVELSDESNEDCEPRQTSRRRRHSLPALEDEEVKISPPKGKKIAKKEDPETTVMKDISSCLTSVSQAMQKDKPSSIDSHELWGQLLAMKLRGLSAYKAEQFKVKVDSLALELLSDD